MQETEFVTEEHVPMLQAKKAEVVITKVQQNSDKLLWYMQE